MYKNDGALNFYSGIYSIGNGVLSTSVYSGTANIRYAGTGDTGDSPTTIKGFTFSMNPTSI